MSWLGLSEPHERYLRLLGFSTVPSGLDGLRALVSAHLRRVPFENVSKLLLYRREGTGRPQQLSEFLDGIEHHDLGGTCYTSNLFLFDLLNALEYDATLLSADMRTPDVHSSIRVRLAGVEYHIDVGYAAPLTEPIALNRLPYAVTAGVDRYLMDAHPRAGSYHLDSFIQGERRHGYVVHPPARPRDFFTGAIIASFRPESTFMRCLRISRVLDDAVVDLRNRTLTISAGSSIARTELDGLPALADALARTLRMPRCPVEVAVDVLERVNGKPFFGRSTWADSVD